MDFNTSHTFSIIICQEDLTDEVMNEVEGKKTDESSE